jgi:hypothetical protein
MLLETEFAIPANSSLFVHFGEFGCSFLELFFGTIHYQKTGEKQWNYRWKYSVGN